MRRLLMIAALVAIASALLPASVAADAPFREKVFMGGGWPLSDVAGGCLGTEGVWSAELDTVSADGKSTLFAHGSETSDQARVHGTVNGHFYAARGWDAPHLYEGSIVVRFNDLVTRDPTSFAGRVFRAVTLTMVPTAGGTPVYVHLDVGVYVQWLPDPDRIAMLIPSDGEPVCD